MSSLVQRYHWLYFTAISLLQLSLFLTVASQNEDQMPSFCTARRARNNVNGCDTERRWFVHESKGCKPFAVCKSQLEQLDAQTGTNYFLSRESCQEACTQYVACPKLSAPENGNVSDGFTGWGGVATYTCDEGYMLRGDRRRECERTATWSLSAPICEKQCPSPSPVNHSTIAPVHNFYSVGTRIFYTCEEGYSSTIKERMCESGGVWSKPEPVCESLQMRFCPEPGLIHNGVFYAPNRAVGDTITYSCNDGYILIGNATRSCGDDERWQGEAPVCFKLSLEYFFEDGANRERMDITNRTLPLPADTRNVWIVTESSHPDPLTNAVPVWFFDSEVVREMEHPHGVELHEHKLKFPRILESKEQEGNYTIKIGGYSVSFRLVVDGVAPTTPMSVVKPELIITPTKTQSNVGGQVRFLCVFTGCPSPNVTWFRNDSVLLPGGRVAYDIHTEHRVTICHLKITNVSEADIGAYRCVGDNPGGNTSSEFVDLVLNGETQVAATQRRKRSADAETEKETSLCKQTSDPESVTLVATASKELRIPRGSRQLRKYRFEVERILKDHLRSLSLTTGARYKRSLRAIFLKSSTDKTATTHLQAGKKYIINGRMVDDVLYISGHHSIHHYSKKLETNIQSC